MKFIDKHSTTLSYEEGLNMYIDNDGNFLSEDMLPEDMQQELRMERMADYGSYDEPEVFMSGAEKESYDKVRNAYLAGGTEGIIEFAEYCLPRQCDCYFRDFLGEKEFAEVIEKAAKLGHIWSIEYLTMAYYHGEDAAFRKNFNKFMYWAKRGQNSEDPKFLYWLGEVLFEVSEEKGQLNSFGLALKSHIKAAKLGSVNAMLNMYRLERQSIIQVRGLVAKYRKINNKRDVSAVKAFDYLSKAAETGNYEAMNIMGIELIKGEICEKNYVEAFGYFEKVVNSHYEKNKNQKQKDAEYISRIKALQEPPKEGKRIGPRISKFIPAFYNLGYCYENGIGCDVGVEKAFEMYCLASRYSRRAELKLAYCFENGMGVDKNTDEALKIYKKMANESIPSGDCYLG